MALFAHTLRTVLAQTHAVAEPVTLQIDSTTLRSSHRPSRPEFPGRPPDRSTMIRRTEELVGGDRGVMLVAVDDLE